MKRNKILVKKYKNLWAVSQNGTFQMRVFKIQSTLSSHANLLIYDSVIYVLRVGYAAKGLGDSKICEI